MTAPSHIPAGFHTLNIYAIVEGADRLLEFVKTVFGATERMRMPLPDGKLAHAEVQIGDSVLELADASAEWPAMPASLHVYVPDIDAVYEAALAAGAVSVAPPSDKFYGERSGSVRDPVGNLWHIATKTEDLSIEEMRRRAPGAQ